MGSRLLVLERVLHVLAGVLQIGLGLVLAALVLWRSLPVTLPMASLALPSTSSIAFLTLSVALTVTPLMCRFRTLLYGPYADRYPNGAGRKPCGHASRVISTVTARSDSAGPATMPLIGGTSV